MINENKHVDSLLYDANRHESGIFNRGMYPALDPDNQYIGKDVPLDKMFSEGELSHCSANPMDKNWCRPEYSRFRVKEGDYKGAKFTKMMKLM